MLSHLAHDVLELKFLELVGIVHDLHDDGPLTVSHTRLYRKANTAAIWLEIEVTEEGEIRRERQHSQEHPGYDRGQPGRRYYRPTQCQPRRARLLGVPAYRQRLYAPRQPSGHPHPVAQDPATERSNRGGQSTSAVVGCPSDDSTDAAAELQREAVSRALSIQDDDHADVRRRGPTDPPGSTSSEPPQARASRPPSRPSFPAQLRRGSSTVSSRGAAAPC